MKKIIVSILLFPTILIGQFNNVILHDHWIQDSLITTYDGESVFNEVWGLELNNEKYAVVGSTMGTHFFKIVNNKLQEIDFVSVLCSLMIFGGVYLVSINTNKIN